MGTLGGKGLRYIEDQNTPPVLKHLNKSQEGNDSKLLQNVSRQNMLCRTSGTAAKWPKLSYVWQHKEGAANSSECAGYLPKHDFDFRVLRHSAQQSEQTFSDGLKWYAWQRPKNNRVKVEYNIPINPLTPRCPLSPKFQFDFKKGSSKNFLWASRLWVGRRQEPS